MVGNIGYPLGVFGMINGIVNLGVNIWKKTETPSYIEVLDSVMSKLEQIQVKVSEIRRQLIDVDKDLTLSHTTEEVDNLIDNIYAMCNEFNEISYIYQSDPYKLNKTQIQWAKNIIESTTGLKFQLNCLDEEITIPHTLSKDAYYGKIAKVLYEAAKKRFDLDRVNKLAEDINTISLEITGLLDQEIERCCLAQCIGTSYILLAERILGLVTENNLRKKIEEVEKSLKETLENQLTVSLDIMVKNDYQADNLLPGVSPEIITERSVKESIYKLTTTYSIDISAGHTYRVLDKIFGILYKNDQSYWQKFNFDSIAFSDKLKVIQENDLSIIYNSCCSFDFRGKEYLFFSNKKYIALYDQNSIGYSFKCRSQSYSNYVRGEWTGAFPIQYANDTYIMQLILDMNQALYYTYKVVSTGSNNIGIAQNFRNPRDPDDPSSPDLPHLTGNYWLPGLYVGNSQKSLAPDKYLVMNYGTPIYHQSSTYVFLGGYLQYYPDSDSRDGAGTTYFYWAIYEITPPSKENRFADLSFGLKTIAMPDKSSGFSNRPQSVVELSLSDVDSGRYSSFITGFTFSRKIIDKDGKSIFSKSQYVFVGCVKTDDATHHGWRIYEIVLDGTNPGLCLVSMGSFNFLDNHEVPLAFHAFETKVDLDENCIEGESEVYLLMTTEKPTRCYILQIVQFGEYTYPVLKIDTELIKK